MDWASIWTWPQLVGWIAFALGMASFLQTSDRRFKQYMSLECAAYVAHFALLGQWAACASASVSMGRSIAAVRYPFKSVGLFFMALSVVCGAWLSSTWVSLLPITSSVLGTFALFFLAGIPMRFVMMLGTLLWLVHNILVGSMGGSVLEGVLLLVNAVTLGRMWRSESLSADEVSSWSRTK